MVVDTFAEARQRDILNLAEDMDGHWASGFRGRRFIEVHGFQGQTSFAFALVEQVASEHLGLGRIVHKFGDLLGQRT